MNGIFEPLYAHSGLGATSSLLTSPTSTTSSLQSSLSKSGAVSSTATKPATSVTKPSDIPPKSVQSSTTGSAGSAVSQAFASSGTSQLTRCAPGLIPSPQPGGKILCLPPGQAKQTSTTATKPASTTSSTTVTKPSDIPPKDSGAKMAEVQTAEKPVETKSAPYIAGSKTATSTTTSAATAGKMETTSTKASSPIVGAKSASFTEAAKTSTTATKAAATETQSYQPNVGGSSGPGSKTVESRSAGDQTILDQVPAASAMQLPAAPAMSALDWETVGKIIGLGALGYALYRVLR